VGIPVWGLGLNYVIVVLLLFRLTNVFIQIEKSCAQIVAMVGIQGSTSLLSWTGRRAGYNGNSVWVFSLCCIPSP
jgi:amino acid permease